MPRSAGKESLSSSSSSSSSSSFPMPAFGRTASAALHSHVVAHISTSSPPASPANSPRLRSGRAMSRGGGGGGGGGSAVSLKSKQGSPLSSGKARHSAHHLRPPLLQKLSQLFISFFFRRHRLLLLIPFVYITGTLLYMGGDIAIPEQFHAPSLPIYRSDLVFEHLWPDMEKAEAESDSVESGAWNDPFGGSHNRQVLSVWEYPKDGGGFTPCVNNINAEPELPESNGYILVEANGGLNQQRSTICNAVAVAKLLNATLIIPHFHFNAVWKDPSKFGDIFDEPYFIKSLSQQVRILHELPKEVMKLYGNGSMIYKIPKVQAWSLPRFYLEKTLPELLQRGVIRFSPFANRLAYDGVPKRLQKLRCYANFVALRFAQPIADIGYEVVKRMKAKSTKSNGNFVAIHLRFEEDMVAFSQCVYDGSKEEASRLENFREHGWKGKFTRIGRVTLSPGEIRKNGKCPLTPVEVGMMLRGMGFRKSTPIFLAAGTIYKGEESMEPLRRMFPYLETKETLMTPEEFNRFKGFSSRLAAIDYIVCLQSEVFVTTQGGNFPQILMGHRRFLNKGHSKTINPDKRHLVLLFNNPHIEWEVFRKQMVDMRRHSDFKGLEPRKSFPVHKMALFTNNPKQPLYTFPAPECMCAETQDTMEVVSQE